MDAPSEPNPSAASDAPLRLERLLPPGEPATIPEIVREMGLWDRAPSPSERPHVMLNMISSVDGRATVSGRSGPLSDTADRKLFHGLRTAVDAILVGAGTARVERYGRLIPEQARRDLRREHGLPEEPLACIVSASIDLGEDIPLLGEGDARVAILTPSTASLPDMPAQVDYVRTGPEGPLNLSEALAELGERFGVQSVLCEGGPHLASELLHAGLVDEVFLSLSPTLTGGDPAKGPALRILAGVEVEPPVALTLLGVLRSESSLFLRYAVDA